MRSAKMSISQKTPRSTITAINWEPKVSGKLLFLTTARLVPCRAKAPRQNPYRHVTNETSWIFSKISRQTPCPMASMKMWREVMIIAMPMKGPSYEDGWGHEQMKMNLLSGRQLRQEQGLSVCLQVPQATEQFAVRASAIRRVRIIIRNNIINHHYNNLPIIHYPLSMRWIWQFYQRVDVSQDHQSHNIIMQKRIKQTPSYLSGFRTVTEEHSDFTPYLINNSFRSCLQPKRASVDIKLYMQLHKKILRKAIIQQNFEDNLYVFEHGQACARKGFIGNARHEKFCRRTNTSHRQKKLSVDTSQMSTIANFKTNKEKMPTETFDQVSFIKSQTTPTKPHLLRSNTAYRKKYRSKNEQQKHFFQFPARQIQPHSKHKVKTVI